MAQSWSKIRKILEEDLIATNLKGRVQYFFTQYHKAPDQYGRFAVRVDGREIFMANPYNEWELDVEIRNLAKKYSSKPMCEWENYDEEYDQIHNEAEITMSKEGIVDSFLVIHYLKEYLNQSIEKSINSENAVIRMFAIMDRRVGKRNLEKFAKTLNEQPEWLKEFYILRLKAENINYSV